MDLTNITITPETDEEGSPTGAVEIQGTDIKTGELRKVWLISAPSWLVAEACRHMEGG